VNGGQKSICFRLLWFPGSPGARRLCAGPRVAASGIGWRLGLVAARSRFPAWGGGSVPVRGSDSRAGFTERGGIAAGPGCRKPSPSGLGPSGFHPSRANTAPLAEGCPFNRSRGWRMACAVLRLIRPCSCVEGILARRSTTKPATLTIRESGGPDFQVRGLTVLQFMTRQEMWPQAYRHRPYLQHSTDAEVAERLVTSSRT
jgi:hypothetical protein